MKATLIKAPDEISDHGDRWEVLRKECGGTIFASSYLTRTWLEAYEHVAEPRVIVIEEGRDLVGVAPLAAYRYRIGGMPIKVLALAGEMKDRLRLSMTSLLFRPDRKDVLERMLQEIKRLDWNLFTTINLMANPANEAYINNVKGTWRSIDFPPGRVMTFHMPPDGELADALDTKARKNLRYRSKLLEREGHHVSYRRVPAEDIDQAVEVYAQQHIERWASKGGSYFRDPDNVRFLKMSTANSYRAGHGHVFELLIDGRVAAQDFTLGDGTTCYGDKTGMSNEFMRYSPGWLVMMHSMSEMRERGAERCVMGIGGESYKYEMGGKEEPLIGIRATRGLVSVMGRASESSAVRKVGSWLGYPMESLEVTSPRQ